MPSIFASWCSPSSLRHVRCSRPKNVSSTPCPLTALALNTGSRPRCASALDLLVGAHAVEVALVELDDERHLLEAQAEVLEVLAQVEERRRVVLGLADLRVGDEGDAVGALETSRRVDAWSTCPGTVKILIRRVIPGVWPGRSRLGAEE